MLLSRFAPVNARAWVVLVAISALLGWLLERAGFPAALLLGPMVAAIGLGASGAAMAVPRWAFIGAQALIGCLVARVVTAPIVASIARDWALMLAVVATTVVAGAVVGFVLTRWGALPAVRIFVVIATGPPLAKLIARDA